ncbi:MAG: hypothetical protein KY455_07945 [Euryarchaeota archaeon]|nr:hypothetical protein [Euryarchaeota archaeon]
MKVKLVLAALAVVVLAMPFFGVQAQATHASTTIQYVGGGYISPTINPPLCISELFGVEQPVHIGGACRVPCWHDPCVITVEDARAGFNVGYKVCVEGEATCRLGTRSGTSSIDITPGQKITVAVSTHAAKFGTVTFQ